MVFVDVRLLATVHISLRVSCLIFVGCFVEFKFIFHCFFKSRAVTSRIYYFQVFFVVFRFLNIEIIFLVFNAIFELFHAFHGIRIVFLTQIAPHNGENGPAGTHFDGFFVRHL